MAQSPLKSYAMIFAGLVTISAIILLVDKYFAGTWLWWGVVILSCTGYLYLRINRDLYWSPLRRKPPATAQYTGPERRFADPESERDFPLSNVVKIEIETTGDGPFDEDLYWIFHLKNARPVRMAGPVAHSQGIIDALTDFDGADIEKTIKAAATVDPALFLIWEQSPHE